MSEKEEEEFQSSNTGWICEKLIDNDNEKVRDHCHVNGIVTNLQLTKKVPVIFHNSRGYDSHLIFDELNKFDVKIDVIPNRLEKFRASFLSKNLVFIESMQFMNSSLKKLVKNLSGSDFKYLTEEFCSENLQLLKQKGAYPYEHMDSSGRFKVKKLPNKECFFRSTKTGKIGNDGKKLDGHISDEDI